MVRTIRHENRMSPTEVSRGGDRSECCSLTSVWRTANRADLTQVPIGVMGLLHLTKSPNPSHTARVKRIAGVLIVAMFLLGTACSVPVQLRRERDCHREGGAMLRADVRPDVPPLCLQGATLVAAGQFDQAARFGSPSHRVAS